MEKNIEELIFDLSNNIKEILFEYRMNNALLKAQCESKFTTYNIPNSQDEYVGQSFIIACKSFNETFNFASNIAKKENKNLYKIFKFNDLNVCAVSNDDDYFLVTYKALISDPRLADAIISKEFNVTIGKGTNARTIQLDLPNVNIIIWTEYVELLPLEIKEAFTIAHT